MIALIQRVKEASVSINNSKEGLTSTPHKEKKIGSGLVILLGVAAEDNSEDAHYLAEKAAHLRIFEDEQGKLNRSLLETKACGATAGEALVVSQFTLLADCRKGRRPSFVKAAPPEQAFALYKEFVQTLQALGVPTKTGEFQELMLVKIFNYGPVTIILDSAIRKAKK